MTYFFFFFFNSMPSSWDLHTCFSEKRNVSFLKLPVYKSLHCNLLSKAVVVRYYSSMPSSWWCRVYFQSGCFPPQMCIENKSFDRSPWLFPLPFKSACVHFNVKVSVGSCGLASPQWRQEFRAAAAVWVRSPGAVLRAAVQAAQLVAFPQGRQCRDTRSDFGVWPSRCRCPLLFQDSSPVSVSLDFA